ncbi:MAG: RNA polymerase sigma-70 factor [Cyclobacteriaceae bacterium]
MPSANLNKFEELFRELFKPLCGFAMKFTGDLDTSKNLVHEVFIQVWEKFDTLPEGTNHKSYCYTAVRNRCLNYIRDRKKFVTIENVPEHRLTELNSTMETSELAQKIEQAIASLPEKCRMVFELNRIEGLKYSEIAGKMNISLKTVEAQMSKALAVMREHLSEFLTIIFIFWT